jgi:hypothetical protein
MIVYGEVTVLSNNFSQADQTLSVPLAAAGLIDNL